MDCLYYTDGLIANKQTLTKLCLLFDKVKFFYLSPLYYLKPLKERWATEKEIPFFSKSPCEKELLTTVHFESHMTFLNKYRELINFHVLIPLVVNQTPPDWESFEVAERKLMGQGAGIAFGLWGQSVGLVPQDKIYVDAPWFALYRWQSISGALHLAIQTGQTPISDDAALSSLACETVSRFSDLKHHPTAQEIASHIAFRSMSLLVPNFPELQVDEIMEVREKLCDELQDFRSEMLSIAKTVDEETYLHIDFDSFIAEKIQPRFTDLELKVKSLKGELFRKIANSFFIGSGATTVFAYFLNLPLAAQIAATASFMGKALIDIHDHQSKVYEIRNQSTNKGLVFLLDMKKKYG